MRCMGECGAGEGSAATAVAVGAVAEMCVAGAGVEVEVAAVEGEEEATKGSVWRGMLYDCGSNEPPSRPLPRLEASRPGKPRK